MLKSSKEEITSDRIDDGPEVVLLLCLLQRDRRALAAAKPRTRSHIYFIDPSLLVFQ